MSDTYRISIERLENGFEVTVPDVAAIEKAEKAASKKTANANLGMPYTGDMTKSYMAASVKDVLKFVEVAVKSIPETDFDSAFAEAAEASDND
jgi:hypothetical protein